MSVAKELSTLKGRDSFAYLGKRLGYDDDKIETFQAVLDTIQEITDKKITPNVMEWDEVGTKLVDGKVVLPSNMEDVLNELIKDNELYSFFVPEELGGMGYTNVAMSALTEILAKADIAFQSLTFISLSVMEALTVYYKESFQPFLDRFSKGEYVGYVGFTEPQAGSNLENVKSTSVKDGDEYIINGTKIFITNGGYAKGGLVLTRNMVDGKQDGHNVFFVEGLDGVTTERLEHKSGLKASPTAQLHFEDVRVPADNIVAEPGQGYKKVLERLMGMRLGVTFQGIGASLRALDLAKQYAEERVQFGKPINQFPAVSGKLNAIEETVQRMRVFGYYGAMALDRYYRGYLPMEVGATGDSSEKMAASSFPGSVRGGLTHYYISTAKMYSSEIVNMIAYDAQQVFGGNGFISEYEINKIARDVRVLAVYEGTSEIHEFIIKRAQEAVNLFPESKFTRISKVWDAPTRYEEMFYSKFTDLKGLI